jgi:hypothetical protein
MDYQMRNVVSDKQGGTLSRESVPSPTDAENPNAEEKPSSNRRASEWNRGAVRVECSGDRQNDRDENWWLQLPSHTFA